MKNIAKTTLIIFCLFYSFNGLALPEITGVEIGEWDYGYEACDLLQTYGFDTADEALAAGLAVRHSDSCYGPIVTYDSGYPSEVYPDRQVIPGCGGGSNVPFYSWGTFHVAWFSRKYIKFSFGIVQNNGECYIATGGAMNIGKTREVNCPEGYGWRLVPPDNDYRACIKLFTTEGDECPANNGGGTSVGNPVNTATGNKFHRENLDLGIDSIPFSLYYSSSTASQSSNLVPKRTFGNGWNHIYAKKVSGIFKVNGNDSIMLRRDDGKQVLFTYQNNQWENISKTPETMIKAGNQWIVKNNNSETETYNRHGNFVSYSQNGKITNFEYEGSGSNRRLTKILSQDGGYVELHYPVVSSAEKIDYISDHTGREWHFDYSEYKLTTITYPDGTTKEFHYGEGNSHNSALTGITDRNNNRFATYEYDKLNRVVHEWHHAKDVNNNDIKVEELTIDYTTEFTRTITNSRDKVSTYTVEQNNGLWQIKDITGPGCSNCSNANTNFVYDPLTNDLLEKTSDGKATKYGNYDTKGQYGYKIDAFGTAEQRQTDYTYDSRFFKKPLTITEGSVSSNTSHNKVTTYIYDEHANILSMTVNGYKPDGTTVSNTTTYQYNGPYNQISQIDGPRTNISDITLFEYYLDDVSEGNNRGRLKKLTNAVGIVLRDNIQYSPTGKILSEDKPNGLTTNYTYYTGNDRLETISNTDGTKTTTTHMDYLASGEVKEITRNYNTPDASTLTLTYDAARRLIKVKDQQDNYVQYTLDTEGNQEFEKTYDPNGVLKKTIAQVFDDYDQVDTSTQSGVTNNMDYGSDGNLYEQTNGNNVKTDYDYDALNRLTKITQDFGTGSLSTANTITEFDYDSQDRVSKVTDANNHHTLYEYDDLGRLVKLTSPDTGIDVFTYDSAGNTTSKLDANANTTSFTYDANNRPTSIDYVGTDLDVTFNYDLLTLTLVGFDENGVAIYESNNGLNQLTSFSDSKSTTTLSYDAFGNLTGKTQTVNNVTTGNDVTTALNYGYDNNNRLQDITYPSGMVATYHYNNLNQITKISTTINGQNVDIVDNINYLPMGPLASMDIGNGLHFSSQYDNGYRLEDYQYGTTPIPILSGDYSYDGNHNITSLIRESSLNNGGYIYDNLDRITNETTIFQGYTYDKLGNRLTVSYGPGVPEAYTYDSSNNRLLKVGNQKERQYDNNGNTKSTFTSTNVFTYNKANRMQTYSAGKTLKAQYFYNGIGQRIYKKWYNANNIPVYYIFQYNANGQLMHESKYKYNNLKQKWSHETIWLGNRPVAQVRTIYDNSGTVIATDIYYILSDHLNTPRKVTNATGTVLWSWNSDAFGTTQANQDVDGDNTIFEFNLRFPGQYFDKESGEHYNYFRDYEPETGRYLESDPIGLRGGMNTFGYVLGNPIKYIDPLGLCNGQNINSSGIDKCLPYPFCYFEPGGCENDDNSEGKIKDIFKECSECIAKECIIPDGWEDFISGKKVAAKIFKIIEFIEFINCTDECIKKTNTIFDFSHRY